MLKNALHKYNPFDKDGSNGEQTNPGGDPRRTATLERGGTDDNSAGSTDESATDDGAPPVGLDEVFELLRNRRRRDVLWYLVETDDRMSIGELAERIAAKECDKPVSQVTSQERKRVYIGLYQGHLPKMDDYGAVAYNQKRGVIKHGSNFELFMEYLPDDEAPWTTDDSSSLLEGVVNLIT